MVCIGIAAGIFLLELWIKNHIEKQGREGEAKPLLQGRLLLRQYHNRGAFLNMGEKVRPLVAAVSLCLTAAIGLLFLCTLGQRGHRLLKAGLTLLLGGAFSNTYDRLKRKYVVDYFSFGVRWKRLRQIVFNISDFCILIGTILVVFSDGWSA